MNGCIRLCYARAEGVPLRNWDVVGFVLAAISTVWAATPGTLLEMLRVRVLHANLDVFLDDFGPKERQVAQNHGAGVGDLLKGISSYSVEDMEGRKGDTGSNGRRLIKGEKRSKRQWGMKSERKRKYNIKMSRVDMWGKNRDMIEIVMEDGE